jgi:hypothetical protein
MSRFRVIKGHRRPIRRQHPVKGGRDPLPACVIRDIRIEVERRAAKFNVSKSFVIAVALAEVFGITEQESYLTEPPAAAKRA